MADQEFKVIIKGDNAHLLKAVDESGTSLSELEKRQIKEAQQALNGLNKTRFSRLKSRLKSVGSTLKSLGNRAKNFGSKMTGVGTRATLALTAPLAALGILGVKFNSLEEDTKTTFKVFLKDGEKAKKLFSELSDFADKTPFQLDEVLSGGTTLLQAKISDLKGVLKDAGDLAAANKTKGATIQDTSNVFSRLKAGDFGEAFERLRDFGISRELLEGEGLKFDKGGSFKGSVEDAIKGVRAIIQRDMGGLMDEQSKNFSGQMSTLIDTGQRFLGDLFKPAFDLLKQGLASALPYVVGLKDQFKELSPQAKVVISVIIGLVAAIGPVLVILGSIVTAIGAFVAALGAIASSTAAIAVIGGIAGAILQLGVPLALIGVELYVLYQLWQNNFGGIRDFTNDAFAGIKSFIFSAMSEISAFVSTILAGIYDFWEKNGEDITKAAKTTYDFLASFVKTGLDKIRAFWKSNGDSIKAIVSAVWVSAQTAFLQIVNVALNAMKLIAAIVNGDGVAAGEAAKAIFKSAVTAIGTIVQGMITILWNVFKLAVKTVISAGLQLQQAAFNLGKNIVLGIANGISNFASTVYTKVKEVASNVLSVFRSPAGFDTRSPSKPATKIGEDVGAGLGIGMLNKLNFVKKSAKTVAKEALQELKDAAIEFTSLAGLGSKQVNQKLAAADLNDLTGSLNEILELRRELQTNLDIDLPSKAEDIRLELELLKSLKAAEEDRKRNAENYKNAIDSVNSSSADRLRQLKEERLLIRAKTDLQKTEIKQGMALIKLEGDLKSKGLTPEQIERIITLQKEKNAVELEGIRQRELSKQRFGAENYRDELIAKLQDETFALQGVNTELSTYQITLDKINESYANAPAKLKESILATAAQIDQVKAAKKAQDEYNAAFKETQTQVRGIFEVLIDTGKSWGEKMKSIFKSVADRFKNMLLDMASRWLTSKLMGGGSGSGSGDGFSIGNLFKGLFGGGGSSSSANGGFGGTAPFSPSFAFAGAGGANGGAQLPPFIKQIQSQITRDRIVTPKAITDASSAGVPEHEAIHASAGAAGKFSLGNLGKSLSGLAPMLGLSLGGALGGGSGIGGLIGSAGGLAGGLLGSALLSGSLTGATTGGIFAGGGLLGLSAIGGITLAAAPLLLLGGWLLGRNKQRRADEQTRNQLSLDSFKQIEDLIKQVNLDEIDGQNALAQANGVRENYLSQANALKDKKTRKIAVKDVSRVDSRISTLRSAVAAQEQRQEIGRNLSAEFHTGGILNASGGRFAGALPRNFSGRIPGSFDRKDDLLMAVSRGETAIVLTPDQWQQTAPFIAPVLKNANVPGFREGGVRQIAAPPIGSKNPQRNGTVEVGNLTVELHGNYDPETIVVKGLRSDKAGKIVVGHVRTEMIDG